MNTSPQPHLQPHPPPQDPPPLNLNSATPAQQPANPDCSIPHVHHPRVDYLNQAGELLAQITIQDRVEVNRDDPEKYEYESWEEAKQEQFRSDGNTGLQSISSAQRVISGDIPYSQQRRENQSTNEDEIDIAAIMQNLQLSIPREIEYAFAGVQDQKPEEQTPFKLLLKVACTSGTPRNIPLQPLNQAMSTVWGDNYWIIDQVKPAVYKAYFRDEEAMDYVFRKQPWTFEGENLLVEWVNPKEEDRPIEDYEFKYIYAKIRVYGVPQRYRGPHLMSYVIDRVGLPSEYHPPPENTMTYTKDYISAYAKLEVTKALKDKVVHPTATSLAEPSKVNQTTCADQHAEWVQNMIATPKTLDCLAGTNDDTEVGNVEDMERNMSPSSLQAAAPAFKAPLSQ
ncbi:hypothetical protein QYE76_054620 [Lolium multiflorum]|uniref:DUF4283 domain-containing protein n=1 Tax=Lolium multiflorum TaxID=4521 RepID=A0AAD8WLI8_LOLMU|nr:hypothetical protein QYE76_054620 [Lolium multiflorum]